MKINVLISCVLILSGIGVLIRIITIFYFYQVKIKKWNTTKGEILESEIVYFRSSTDADTEGWKNKVLYMFKAQERIYKSNQVTKNIGYLTPIKSLSEKEKFRKGECTIVYYNPNNPEDSILDNEFNYNSLFYLVFTVLSFYFANLIYNQ